jgi:outer membrane protein assembly factor BamB
MVKHMNTILRPSLAALIAIAAILPLPAQEPANWPQFRGENSAGIAASGAAPPVEFGPAKHLLWKQAVPFGHSSPSVWGDRIFLTAFDKDSSRLELLCLDRKLGHILWRRPVAAEKIEKVHAVSSPATATPAVDGERVYAYFASYGLMAFQLDGKPAWTVPLPMPQTLFGSGASPVVAGELVILNRDAVADAYLLAVDRRSGKTVWKQPYPANAFRAAESYSTPVLWRDQAILHRAGLIEGYGLKDGKRRWWVNAATSGTSTVAAGKDLVYAATWSPFGEADQRLTVPDFATLLKRYDSDGDGQISESEFPADLAVARRPDAPDVPGATIFLKKFFSGMDANKDGLLQEKEWEGMRANLAAFHIDHGLIAFRPGGEGDLTAQVAWREKTAIPEVPSPLVYQNRVYMVRNGGIITCLDAQSGKMLYRGRLGAGGPYYASPVAADGKVYAASGEGAVVVLSAADKLDVLARNNLGEEIFGTPAIAGSRIYVRTAHHLYAFGEK